MTVNLGTLGWICGVATHVVHIPCPLFWVSAHCLPAFSFTGLTGTPSWGSSGTDFMWNHLHLNFKAGFSLSLSSVVSKEHSEGVFFSLKGKRQR